MWGEAGVGEVTDAWYASTGAVHMLVYAMAPGGRFGSTDEIRTVFDADQLYYVLEGMLALANPRTGEVRVIHTGEAAYVGRGVWTHGVACSDGAVRVLELVSPGLQSEEAIAYTRSQPPLGSPIYARTDLHGRWPMTARRSAAPVTIAHLRERDLLWRLDGDDRVLTGTWLSTGRATVETVQLLPGQRTDVAPTLAETCVYVLDGRLGARLPESERPWLELDSGDGLHLPPGVPHCFQTFARAKTRFLRLTAP